MNELDDADEPQGGGGFLTHLPVILWHRRWFIIVPFILGIVGAILANLLIPATYRSSALMLVQSPQLSGAMIGADGAEIVDRRIARINEQVTSRPDLVALIEKHGLYKDLRATKPLSEVIEKMRGAIVLTPTGVDGGNPSSNNRTIAFRLSFDYGMPQPAQAVAQDLMQRIVELDATGNSEAAARRVSFLTEEANGLQKRISEIQDQIAQINTQNGGVLSNTNMLVSNGGSYSAQIAALTRDNANLIIQRDAARNSDTRDPIVTAAEQQLAAARAVYSENHPDVAIAKQRLAEARELAKNNTQKLPYEVIDQQLAFNNSQIASLRAAMEQERAQFATARSAQSRAPLIQSQLAELQQQLSGVNDKYQNVSTQLMAARAGVRADDEQLGERLAVVDPPVVPDKPIWPDRLLIAGIGLAGGLGLGLVLALGVEILLQPIRDPTTLAVIVGASPLVTIPLIKERPKPQTQRRWPIIGRSWFRSR
jgi:uncharacterized protein involved in exopolysaccharide biosynthesis